MLTGLLLVLLGAWGAIIPFVGPAFDYAYTPDTSWTWTAGRFWLEVLPGAAAFLGGLILMFTANRATAVFGGWLACAAGVWFLVGPVLGQLWNGPEGAAGVPVGDKTQRVVEQIGFFSGLGAAILLVAALAVGRMTVRSMRDIEAAQVVARRRTAEPATAAAPAATAPVAERRMTEREAERGAVARGPEHDVYPTEGEPVRERPGGLRGRLTRR